MVTFVVGNRSHASSCRSAAATAVTTAAATATAATTAAATSTTTAATSATTASAAAAATITINTATIYVLAMVATCSSYLHISSESKRTTEPHICSTICN